MSKVTVDLRLANESLDNIFWRMEVKHDLQDFYKKVFNDYIIEKALTETKKDES